MDDAPHVDEQELIRDGFPGQRMLVLPRPLVRAALATPVTRELLVTDAGYFPRAGGHGRIRHRPISQAVVMICVRGRGWCATPAGRFDVRQGEVAILPPHLPHSYGADPEDPWTLWWIHISGESVPILVEATGATTQSPVQVPGDLHHLAALATELISVMERDTTAPRLLEASGIAWHLMTSLITSHKSHADTDELLDTIAQQLRDNLGNRPTVSELASTVGLSASHFAALFRQRFKVPVNQYQIQLRMARARELLDTTSRPVADVARELGYDDAFYFARQFGKLHGISPSKYRRQDKG
ncbi:AraC family transcriptional regulator [Acidipropionibacterium virtanenii]|uniref:Arabinose operon regulatory protein n=1 Tax=Acidipropionibacterium virtanenii TaxID=2057246 RepID=A0A344UXT1_9ACTN|nr:AraC family transcriptional regulator [Acidipropionibacterium virtanenii]AXE40079.1 Arabinose operon regulatory protein [Acidipropionibacterium virtanenii]